MDKKIVVENESSVENDHAKRLSILEAENKKMREEFNIQRAKMRDLYLQKEGECVKLGEEISVIKKELDEAKSQILLAEYRNENEIQTQDRKAQEEIASLQHLIQETIEESSQSKADHYKLHQEYERLRAEYLELRDQQQQDSPSLAPVLSQVKKTIARKLGGDTSSQDNNLEDSMRKVNKYAQEDAEMLRSLVVPLEEEIKALKEKLRSTDHELQKYGKSKVSQSALVGLINENNDASSASVLTTSQTNLQAINTNNINKNSNNSMDNKLNFTNNMTTLTDGGGGVNNCSGSCGTVEEPQCNICVNYKGQLSQLQKTIKDEQQKFIDSEKLMEHIKEELQKESELRQDLELQWQEKRDMHKEEVQTLTRQLKKTDLNFNELQKHFNETKKDINEDLLKLTDEREQIHRHLEMLQRDNDILSGKYIAHSQLLQNQEINLPNNVEELQENLLTTHEYLIEAKIGCEHAEQEMVTLRDETQLLRAQLGEQKRETTLKIRHLEDLLNVQKAELQKTLNHRDIFERKDIEFKKVTAELREQVIELREANDKLEKTNMDLKQKMFVLQQELSNSEAVQKDFVRLSQSLQMELEKIRAADTQVRWQEDDDIDHCANCKIQFTVTKRKQHCRHCGTIYCENCLSKKVQTGPNKKEVRVCDVCHTLLERNTAPYFSRAPPQSPL